MGPKHCLWFSPCRAHSHGPGGAGHCAPGARGRRGLLPVLRAVAARAAQAGCVPTSRRAHLLRAAVPRARAALQPDRQPALAGAQLCERDAATRWPGPHARPDPNPPLPPAGRGAGPGAGGRPRCHQRLRWPGECSPARVCRGQRVGPSTGVLFLCWLPQSRGKWNDIAGSVIL
jgi:hypothetical protein